MPEPEDFVDAPAGSPRAKLERQRKGASKYNAIPEAVKKDPVGTAELLLAGFGMPEFKSGVETTKGIVAAGKKVVGNKDGYGEVIAKKPVQGGKSATPGNYTPPAPKTAKYDPYPAPSLVDGEKAGSLASKVARFGRPDDPATQTVQGLSVGKTGLEEAQKAGENKAKKKLPKASQGAVVSSGSLIAGGWDSGSPTSPLTAGQGASMGKTSGMQATASTGGGGGGMSAGVEMSGKQPSAGVQAASAPGGGGGGARSAAVAGKQTLEQQLSNSLGGEASNARLAATLRNASEQALDMRRGLPATASAGLRALKKGGVIKKKAPSAAELIYHGHHGEPA